MNKSQTVKKILTAMWIAALGATPIFADYKISQKTTMDDVTIEQTVYSKGVRERRESKTILAGDPEEQAMMAKMMPSLIEISQCDLKQNVSINEAKKAFFIDYYDWSALPAERSKNPGNQKIVVRGTAGVSAVVTDSGKRQELFGLTARWLKSVQTIESSADSCDGQTAVRVEQEGWFVNLRLERESCQSPQIAGAAGGGCRPKLIVKTMQNPGFFLEGTTKMFENNKLQSTIKLQTTALSKAALDQSLFEIPQNYREVLSHSDLTGGGGFDPSNLPQISEPRPSKAAPTKTIAIDFFSGNVSKIDQDELRGYLSSKLSVGGFSGFPVNSPADIAAGNFRNVIGVELKKIKESGARKIGGLFGKVTGSDDAAKLGESEAEIVITIYGGDGKTIAARAAATEKIKGGAGDAVKAAIDKILGDLLSQIK